MTTTIALTVTIEEACLRHSGMKHSTLRKICIQNQIKAQKVGKCWHVPVQELDRIFLGIIQKG
jgi:hypothetical protein